MTERATHHCVTPASNQYDVVVEGVYGDVARVRVVKAYQPYGNQPGATFGLFADSLKPIKP